MNSFIEIFNNLGGHFSNFAWPMLWQSSLLMAILFALDFALARKIRASIRYALWLTVLVKLLLPPTLALPTGAAWWFPAAKPTEQIPKTFTITYDATSTADFLSPKMQAIAPASPKLNHEAWLLLASVAVSAGLLFWLAFRWSQIVQKVRGATTSDKFQNLLAETRRLAGLRGSPRLKLIEGQMSPAVCGLFHPVILLPRVMAENFSAEQLKTVLLHEMIHLRRGDVWLNFFQAILQIIYWWHPLLWLANTRIRRVREEAVDDAVMLALRGGAEIYPPTLLKVAKFSFRRPLASLGLVGILESRSALRQRIERLLNFRAPRKAGLTFLSFCGIFVFSAVALPMGQAPVSGNKQMSPPAASEDFGTSWTDLMNRIRTKAMSEKKTGTNFEMRTFKMDTNIFLANLANLQSQFGLKQTNVAAALNNLFENLGVNLSSPKSIFYNDGLGLLFVYATKSDLDTIERAVSLLGSKLEPQIHIKARFFEMPEKVFYDAALESSLAGITNEMVLSNSNFKVLWDKLKMSAGTEELAEPEVTTIGGRQTQMRATEIVTAVTNFAFKFKENSDVAEVWPQTAKIETGPVLDVVPKVLADDYTIDLKTTASVVKFLGYAGTTNLSKHFVTNTVGEKMELPIVLPVFQTSESSATHATLHDNQTLVLLPKPENVSYSDPEEMEHVSKFIQEAEKKSGDKMLVVFVTATLIDAAGNRLHSDDEMPFAQKEIPLQ